MAMVAVVMEEEAEMETHSEMEEEEQQQEEEEFVLEGPDQRYGFDIFTVKKINSCDSKLLI